MRYPRLPFGSVVAGLVCLAMMLLPSCGPRQRVGQVAGKVLNRGRPLADGNVNFHLAEKGFGAITRLDASGNFTFPEPLPTGTYAVYVTPPEPEPSPKGPIQKPANIPVKYRDPKTSGLSFEVKAGQNDCPIELAGGSK